MPISATITSPHLSAPGISTCPGFLRKKVTVTSASTTISSRPRPRSPCNPLGTSTATTEVSDMFSSSTISATLPSSARVRPAPNSASTTTVASLIASGVSGTTAPSQRFAISAASPRSDSRLPSSAIQTSQPNAARWRAATNPSPPLFPGPHNTTAFPRTCRSITASATARPAFSISVSDGTPCASA